MLSSSEHHEGAAALSKALKVYYFVRFATLIGIIFFLLVSQCGCNHSVDDDDRAQDDEAAAVPDSTAPPRGALVYVKRRQSTTPASGAGLRSASRCTDHGLRYVTVRGNHGEGVLNFYAQWLTEKGRRKGYPQLNVDDLLRWNPEFRSGIPIAGHKICFKRE